MKSLKILAAAKEGVCFFCSKKMALLWDHYKGKRVKSIIMLFSPEYLFHVQESHGLSPELLEQILE